jgi:hypothetical protein
LPYSTELYISGTSEKGYKVKIFLDGAEIAVVEVDENGRFSFTHKDLLKDGSH